VDDHGGGADGGGRIAGLLEDLARAVADVGLRRADVDQVGRVYVEVERRVAQLLRVGALRRLAPALRGREEDLDALGADRLRLAERVLRGEMGADGLQGA
jgi:hypothetical protein